MESTTDHAIKETIGELAENNNKDPKQSLDMQRRKKASPKTSSKRKRVNGVKKGLPTNPGASMANLAETAELQLPPLELDQEALSMDKAINSTPEPEPIVASDAEALPELVLPAIEEALDTEPAVASKAPVKKPASRKKKVVNKNKGPVSKAVAPSEVEEEALPELALSGNDEEADKKPMAASKSPVKRPTSRKKKVVSKPAASKKSVSKPAVAATAAGEPVPVIGMLNEEEIPAPSIGKIHANKPPAEQTNDNASRVAERKAYVAKIKSDTRNFLDQLAAERKKREADYQLFRQQIQTKLRRK
ncbi:MAG: hypothetical protein AAFO69_11420 [Bacteroidota bacterium]